MIRPMVIVVLLLQVNLNLHAQTSKTQQLTGEYLGLAQLVDGSSANLSLMIDQQNDRRFLGAFQIDPIDLPIRDPIYLPVAGTIAASDNCTVQGKEGEIKTTLKLNWETFGGGGAVLSGLATVDASKELQSQTLSVAFLRPFANPGIRWNDDAVVGPATAIFRSVDGSESLESFTIVGGSTGMLAGYFGPEEDGTTAIGTSDNANSLVVISVKSDTILKISAQVALQSGLPSSIGGTYVIETAQGKIVDAGIIAILIGLR